MYRIVVLVLCCHVLSQPVSNEAARRARELIECCPCPKDGEERLAGGSLARSGVDDCPCRARGADSEGAASLFFPAALRPDDSRLSSSHAKEDPKNMLEPEVALATSVLDTLREATEQEYQDAIAREAARSAVESDAVPEETARNMVIVVNPNDSDNDDDFMSAASHVQEARCIHPLGSTALDRTRSSANPVKMLSESFKLPIYKHLQLPRKNLLHFDSNTGASDVQERVVDTNGNSPIFSPQKHEGSPKNNLHRENVEFTLDRPNIFKLRKVDENKPEDSFKLSLVPKFNSRENHNVDLDSATSNLQHQIESTTDKISQLFRYDKLPTNIRNLLKLRDVELIPKTIRNKSRVKPKLDVSKFSLPTLLNVNRNNNFNPEAKYSSDEPCSLDNDTSKIRNIEDVNTNDNINDNISAKNVELLPNDNINSILNKNTNNGDLNDATENSNIDSDISAASSSQIQTSVINNDKHPKAVVLSQNVADCDSFDLEESNIGMKPKQVLQDSQGIFFDSPNFEDMNQAIEENVDDNISSQNQGINTQSQDIDTESSNQILVTQVPFENPNEIIKESAENSEITNIVDSESVANHELGNNFSEISQEIPSLRETLSGVRENYENNFEEPLTNPGLLRNINDNTKTGYEGKMEIDNNVGQQATKFDSTKTADSENDGNLSNVSLKDLQNMSDKLLGTNLNSQSDNYAIDSTTRDIADSTNLKSNVENINSDDESHTKLNSLDIKENNDLKKNACPTNSDTKTTHVKAETTIKSATQDTEHKEMDTGASDTVINTLPGMLESLNPNLILRTPLLTDTILQPARDPLKLLEKPLGNVLSLNPNLPTLDDIRERIVSIFNKDDGSLENDSTSLEADFTNESPQEIMATEASTKSFQRELPLLNHLGGSNDLIQKKQRIPNPFDPLTKSRILDLNSYRAHLPSPSSLELKPINIEPKLRTGSDKNKPLVNFGSDKTRKVGPSKTLVNPLDGIPTLEELRNMLRVNSKSLLKNSVHPTISLHENLRSHEMDDVAKNIQLNAQKTLKGIQKKMNLSLRKPQLRNPLGESLAANPQDLLDDMNDKLKGIHYDLNDRLSSIRESILDSSGINSILDKPGKAQNRNVMSNLRKPKTKPPLSRLQTAASTNAKQEINPHLLGIEPRNFINPDWSMSRKTQATAESAPTQATAHMPKSSPLSYLHRTVPFRQNPTVSDLLKERTPVAAPVNKDLTNSRDKSALFKTVNAFDKQSRQNKVTISFATTTARPPSPPVIKIPSKSVLQQHKDPSVNYYYPGNDAYYMKNAASNAAVTPGKFNTFRTSAPVPSPIDEDYEDTLNNFPNEEFPLIDTKLKSSVLREMPKPSTIKIHSNSGKFKSANNFDNVGENHATHVKTSRWPKVIENDFVSKMRDVNTNMQFLNVPKPVKEIKNEQSDMLRSPTETTDVIINEPLKENVSYRCRMVCTKEIK